MILLIIFEVLLGLAIGLLINAGIVWVLCWALNLAGITTIGSWPVHFSWPLVLVFTIITGGLLRGIIGGIANAFKETKL